MSTIDQLYRTCREYLPASDLAIIERAYVLAESAHEGQFRKSGLPYIVHPVNVACILADLKQDTPTICAGLLHDTVEDTHVSEAEVEAQFGHDICSLVMGVTKLGKFKFDSKEAEQAENFRKMFLAMAQDVRVVIIKLADRLHNMRTLTHLPPNKQHRIARETREIFAPLAHRMGMWNLKWELEDLAFQALEPEAFARIKKLVATNRTEREDYVDQFIAQIAQILTDSGLHAEVTGRPKHLYSIYQKLEQSDIPFEELYDVLGIRVFVNTIPECYQVLGVMHSHFKPISGRIKDYIAVPKSNFYQSLHTTVIGPLGKPIEIQIRTLEMHQVAEYGVAAHWQYKAQKSGPSSGDFSWLREIVDFHYNPNTPADFLRELRLDLFIEEVFVFSPKGDIQLLPKGATPVDFAYKIHTEIGHCCVGAKVNGHIVPLDYILHSGDRIEILKSKTPSPKLDWLEFVATSQAKNRIKQWVKRLKSLENSKAGKRKFEKVLLMSGLTAKEASTPHYLSLIKTRYSQFSISTLDDVHELIGKGDILPRELLRVYREDTPATDSLKVNPDILRKSKSHKDGDSSGVTVLGERNISVKFAQCCKPLPGDSIIGFVTMGAGVSVHRADCGHIFHLPAEKKARLVEVEWDAHRGNRHFSATLSVNGFNRVGFLQDILTMVTNRKLTLSHLETRLHDHGGMVGILMIVEIPDVGQLELLISAIQGVSDVVSVQRS
jgi:guanosine-3',5'-bis(diphosphate) 3'-pyrophosphohydrolase